MNTVLTTTLENSWTIITIKEMQEKAITKQVQPSKKQVKTISSNYKPSEKQLRSNGQQSQTMTSNQQILKKEHKTN